MESKGYHGASGYHYDIWTIVNGVLVGCSARPEHAVAATLRRLREKRPTAKLVVKTVCTYSGDVIAERVAS
jgi:hypothetical protein